MVFPLLIDCCEFEVALSLVNYGPQSLRRSGAGGQVGNGVSVDGNLWGLPFILFDQCVIGGEAARNRLDSRIETTQLPNRLLDGIPERGESALAESGLSLIQGFLRSHKMSRQQFEVVSRLFAVTPQTIRVILLTLRCLPLFRPTFFKGGSFCRLLSLIGSSQFLQS